ncbi:MULTISPECIES: ComEA family DNA-binding protein [Pasteurellaceae]|uniref:ComEA family DNA-binding protein n=1 Tax=Pasteurellaceae TaxID=712 RepID=UPI0035695F0D
MKLLKSVLALSVALAVSAVSFAAENPMQSAQDSAKKTAQTMKQESLGEMQSAKRNMQDKAAAVKEKTGTMKTESVEKVRSNAVDKTTHVKKVVTEHGSAVKKETVTVKRKININKADSATLQKLSGIGEEKAKAIIEYRNKAGKIKSAADLSKVPGIGRKTAEQIAPHLTY